MWTWISAPSVCRGPRGPSLRSRPDFCQTAELLHECSRRCTGDHENFQLAGGARTRAAQECPSELVSAICQWVELDASWLLVEPAGEGASFPAAEGPVQ
eukprot:8714113-Pyramimonas_sp.AAC.1